MTEAQTTCPTISYCEGASCTTRPWCQSHARPPSPCIYLCASPVHLPVCQYPWLLWQFLPKGNPVIMSWTPMTYLIKPDTCTAWRYVTWLIMCLLCVCSALYCELSAGLSCQAVSSGVAGYSCLPAERSPIPPLLCLLEVHLVRADSWQVAAEIEQVDWPASSMVRFVFFCAEERNHMMMVVGNKVVSELF